MIVALVTASCGSQQLPPANSLIADPVQTSPPFDLGGGDSPIGELTVDGSDVRGGTDVPGSSDDVIDAPASNGDWVDATANLVGLESDCGNLSFVSARPGRDEVIVGVALQGLWSSLDGAEDWTPLGRTSGSDAIGNRTSWIEYDPDSPDRYWQSGTYAAGVFTTVDGGQTFEQLGDAEHVDYVSVDLADPLRRTLLAGGHERSTVYRSIDGGQTWSDVSSSLPVDSGYSSYPVVLDEVTHLLGTNNGARSGIFRTEDGGLTWSRVFEQPVIGAPVKFLSSIYWLIADGGGLVVSRDGGFTFEITGVPTGGRPASLVPMPDGQLATYGVDSILVTSDDGETWEPVGSPLPFEPFGLAYAPDRGAFYIWTFTCDFSGAGNPVLPESIMRLDYP